MSNGFTILLDLEKAQGGRVFYDPTMIRRQRVRRLTIAALCVLLTWFLAFFDGIIFNNQSDKNLFVAAKPLIEVRPEGATLTSLSQTDPAPDLVSQVAYSRSEAAACAPQTAPLFSASAAQVGETFVGHLPGTLDWGRLSLASSCGALGVLVPDWISIVGQGETLGLEVAEPYLRQGVVDYISASAGQGRLLPTVKLDLGENAGGYLTKLHQSEGSIVAKLVDTAQVLRADGLCISFQDLDAAQFASLRPMYDHLTEALHAAGLQSCMVLSINQKIWADKTAMQGYDRIILTAFADPWVGTVPGPLAANDWFKTVAKEALDAIGPDRLTLAIGAFAVEWTPRKPLPETLPYAEALRRIAQAGGTIRYSAQTGNSFGSYSDASGKIRKVWMLDAASALNQIVALRQLGLRNIGIWSLGQEDPGLWQALSHQSLDADTLSRNLSEVSFPNYVSYQGKGAFLRVMSEPQVGQRVITFDPETAMVSDMRYTRLPKPYLLERYGAGAAQKLVLTFDDGPNPEYTNQILDVLKEENAPAAFFVIGTQVLAEPKILKRMYDEGHEIGSHTFSHPHMDQISPARTEFELGMINKIITSYSGHSTRLYREPYMNSSGPLDEKGVQSLLPILAEGGIVAGMDILPRDWEGLSTEEIVKDVVSQVDSGAGNVILMHDGGDKRQPTVDALPILIRQLRAKGYEFTTFADLLQVDAATLMPPATEQLVDFNKLSFDFLSTAWKSLTAIFWVVLLIGLARTLGIFAMAFIRRNERPMGDAVAAKVTVVIPAHNEEAGVAKCIRSVLASTYDNLEVLVVDDGSMDDTFYALLEFQNTPRVRVMTQFNQGKWSALNAAIAQLDSEIVVCIDADTQIHPEAIAHLARQFGNPQVGAVAGKIIVGNRINLLTRLQALEYITAQNFDRRGFDLIDGMMVVPGAIGAWRTSAVRAAGGFCNDTITEDSDLTVSLHRLGYRVTYEDKAIAYTEAPETVGQLLSQRLRWSLGMLQCAWKHKSAIREGRSVGLVSIPDMFIFGYLFPLLAPIADLFVAIFIFNTLAAQVTGDFGEVVASRPSYLIVAYFALPLLDLLVAAYALYTDKNEKMSLLWLYPFQRLLYRPLLYLSVYRAVFRAIAGSFAGWGKLKRSSRQFVPVRTP